MLRIKELVTVDSLVSLTHEHTLWHSKGTLRGEFSSWWFYFLSCRFCGSPKR